MDGVAEILKLLDACPLNLSSVYQLDKFLSSGPEQRARSVAGAVNEALAARGEAQLEPGEVAAACISTALLYMTDPEVLARWCEAALPQASPVQLGTLVHGLLLAQGEKRCRSYLACGPLLLCWRPAADLNLHTVDHPVPTSPTSLAGVRRMVELHWTADLAW